MPTSEAELEAALEKEEAAADEPEADAPRSLRPGQKGFAERLMAKYGWTKGTGLGASGTGIINPLRVQLEKRKQKSDAEGGGFVGPGGKGKIVGGKKKPGTEEEGKFGAMSDVVVTYGMVDGMDLDAEIAAGLIQEIGEECNERVECLTTYYIDVALMLLVSTVGSSACLSTATAVQRKCRSSSNSPVSYRLFG